MYVTQAVYDELQAELTDIEQVRKPQMASLLGSISAEIEPEDRTDATVEEQMELLERREAEIRNTLAAAEVVSKPTSTDTVGIGSTVTIDEDGIQHAYTIVGSVGADANRGWITTESPLGAGLIGHRRGDKVTIVAPDGPRMLRVVAIE